MSKLGLAGLSVAALILRLPALADQPEQPVGLVMSAGGSKLVRLNSETPLGARAGDLLFAGDIVRTDMGSASFLFCPAKQIATLGPSGEVRLDTKEAKVKTGKLSQLPAQSCSLPKTLRIEIASQQHYGVTMTRGGVDAVDTPPVTKDNLPADVVSELAPFEAALVADPKDAAALVAEANVFESHNLPANAYDVYTKLREQWPDAVWVKSKLFDLQQALASSAAAAKAAAAGSGQTYALLIGVSKFNNPELSLQFAHADASDFGKLVSTPRGGGLPPENVMLLTDEKATVAAVRLGFQDFLKRRAGKDDTVIILVASHGTVETPGSKSAYILTYDSDPQDLKSTSLPMAELRSLFEDQLAKVGRVVIFVDVCKASTIGSIRNTTVNSDVQRLQDAEGQLLGLMASRARELSFEGPQFGNGHGAFSYAVIKGLAGAADENKDGSVNGNELIRYVVNDVPKATGDKQHPTDISNSDVGNVKLADLNKPGMEISLSRPVRSREPSAGLMAAAAQQLPPSRAPEDLEEFGKILNAGRLLPDQTDNAFDMLRRLQYEVSTEQLIESRNQLRVALENKAQEILLTYLAGDERPQAQKAFADGARYMEAARTLTGESLLLEARENFFRGRALLFDKKFDDAAPFLEQAVRMDPDAAYGYNALGIAYLEQAQFEKAIPAFRDASRRAQHWSYPLHNAALAYVEIGDYKSAIRSYQQAIQLTPNYSYLPYNLGLVYQRLNRKKDAEASYKKASMLSPDSPEPHNALGTLQAANGKNADAEKSYQKALSLNPSLLPARHNLALLLSHEKGREEEAIELWHTNLTQAPDYLPSHLSLAGFLAERGDNTGAVAEYRAVLALRPDYVAARLAAGRLLARTDPESALAELRQGTTLNPESWQLFEQIGDIEAARGKSAEAKAAYEQIISITKDSETRKRIARKLRSLK